MFGLIIFLIFTVGLLRDYGKWFCYLVVALPFLSPISILWWGTTSDSLIFVVCLLFPFKVRRSGVEEKFPLTVPVVILATSFLLSNYFAAERHNGTMICSIMESALILVLFFYLYMSDKKRLQSVFIRACVVFGFIVGLCSFYEMITNDNPLMRMLLENEWIHMERLVEGSRFGVKRLQGIFTMHGTNGTVALLLFAILFHAMRTGYLKGNAANFFLLALLCLTVFFSGTRSCIAGFVVCMLAFMDIRKFGARYFLSFIVLFALAYLVFQSYFDEIVMSFFDTESVEGSNVDMREEQLELTIMFFQLHPLVGNGLVYCGSNVMGTYLEMRGAESLWFPILIDTGILGVLGYLTFFIYCIRFCVKRHVKNLTFFVLAFMTINTMTSIPSFNIVWIFPFLMVMTEMSRERTAIRQQTMR